MACSSCKGLLGLTGACFVAYKSGLDYYPSRNFYFNLETHKNTMTTGPYHAITSLYGIIDHHSMLIQRVKNSKNFILNKYKQIVRKDNQPYLCTYLKGEVLAKDENIVLYTPRSKLSGSVICHFGEIHTNQLLLGERISVQENKS